MDRGKIWLSVTKNYEAMKKDAPSGCVPVIDLFLAGRSEPVRPAHVQTSSDQTFPWILLVCETKDGGDAFSPDDCLIAVPEQYIERIEMRYERSEGQPVGFTCDQLEDALNAPLPTAGPPKPADSAQSVTPPPARENPPPPSGDSQND
jgi:hypothetical protein